jgi:exopolyphosphatase / guanosine-5'-triphosphate,3'-diphosphate pyrophosphatase
LKVSVVDLGFNSVKLVNYHLYNDNSYNVYEEKGVKVRLGDGFDEAGHLRTEPMRRTINALKLLHDIISLQSIKHVLAVATSAVREARNKDNFLKQVFKETGFRFRVLSGKEEALYSYAGAIKSICIPTSLFFDLGGGSLEIVYADNFKIKKFITLPLGALRLTQNYGKTDGTFTKKNYSKMEQYILKVIPSRKELDMNPDTSLVGAGGTIRSISRYDQELKGYALDKIHNYRLNYQSAESINSTLYKMTSNEKAKIDVISSNRAETITAGSCVITMLMRKLGFEKVVISNKGLREGVLSEFIESSPKSRHPQNTNQDQTQNSVRLFCNRQEIIQKSVYSLLSPLISVGLIKQREYEIIAYAIKHLSKIPLTINLHNLFYTIIDEDISYLSHSEQLVLALSIVHTRKPKTANWLFMQYGSILQSKNRYKSIEKIGACIMLVKILEKSKAKIKLVTYKEKKIFLSVLEGGGRGNPIPLVLLENTLRNLGTSLGVRIDYLITKANPAKKVMITN